MLFPHQDNSCDSMSHGRREGSEMHAKAGIEGDGLSHHHSAFTLGC